MVSNASDDFPERESPVTTTRLSRGISTETFLRLWTRAPWTAMVVRGAARPLSRLECLAFMRGGGSDGPTGPLIVVPGRPGGQHRAGWVSEAVGARDGLPARGFRRRRQAPRP